MSGGKPILSEAEQYLSDTWTSLPGEILSFDGIKADIRPLSKIVLRDGSLIDFPYLTDILVITPSTQDYGIKFPVKKGDRGMLHFQDRDISNLLLNNETKPLTSRMHELADAVFYLGFSTFDDAVASDNTLRIYHNNGLVQIKEDGTIVMSNGSKITITPDNVEIDSPLTTITGQLIINGVNFALHQHTAVQTGSGVSGPPVPAPPAP